MPEASGTWILFPDVFLLILELLVLLILTN